MIRKIMEIIINTFIIIIRTIILSISILAIKTFNKIKGYKK